MIYTELEIAGAFLIEEEQHEDERGFFARMFCADEFKQHGMNPDIVQLNTSFNARAGTVRGMHYQIPPAMETKVVRCIRGAIQDVIVDLRPESATLGQQVTVTLSAENRNALYIPKMCAHGFQSLEDDSEVLYMMSEFHMPECARGFCHDDPAFDISWPNPISVISEKDQAWPAYDGASA